MSTPAKPKPAPKSSRNQPPVFAEAMAAPLQPALPGFDDFALPTLRRPSRRWQLAGIVLVWLGAVCALGIGIGQVLSSRNTSLTMPGIPVTTQSLAVAPVSASSLTTSSTSINTTLSLAAYQPAQGSSTLQPGFVPFAPAQGTIGTAPVR